MKIFQKVLNFTSFLSKAYTEGIYNDSPLNRKLGRVGMSYTEYAEKMKKGEVLKPQTAEKESEYVYQDNPHNRDLGRVGMTQEQWKKYSESKAKTEEKVEKTKAHKDKENKIKLAKNFSSLFKVPFYYNTERDLKEFLNTHYIFEDNERNKELNRVGLTPKEWKAIVRSVKEELKNVKDEDRIEQLQKIIDAPIFDEIDNPASIWKDAKEENINVKYIVPSVNYNKTASKTMVEGTYSDTLVNQQRGLAKKKYSEYIVKDMEQNFDKDLLLEYFNNPSKLKEDLQNADIYGISLEGDDWESNRVVIFGNNQQNHLVAAAIFNGMKEIPIKIIPSKNLFAHLKENKKKFSNTNNPELDKYIDKKGGLDSALDDVRRNAVKEFAKTANLKGRSVTSRIISDPEDLTKIQIKVTFDNETYNYNYEFKDGEYKLIK